MLCLVDSDPKRPSAFRRAPGSKQMLAYCLSLENCVTDWVTLEPKLGRVSGIGWQKLDTDLLKKFMAFMKLREGSWPPYCLPRKKEDWFYVVFGSPVVLILRPVQNRKPTFKLSAMPSSSRSVDPRLCIYSRNLREGKIQTSQTWTTMIWNSNIGNTWNLICRRYIHIYCYHHLSRVRVHTKCLTRFYIEDTLQWMEKRTTTEPLTDFLLDLDIETLGKGMLEVTWSLDLTRSSYLCRDSFFPQPWNRQELGLMYKNNSFIYAKQQI